MFDFCFVCSSRSRRSDLFFVLYEKTKIPAAIIDSSCTSGTSTLVTYNSNFIARQFYAPKVTEVQEDSILASRHATLTPVFMWSRGSVCSRIDYCSLHFGVFQYNTLRTGRELLSDIVAHGCTMERRRNIEFNSLVGLSRLAAKLYESGYLRRRCVGDWFCGDPFHVRARPQYNLHCCTGLATSRRTTK